MKPIVHICDYLTIRVFKQVYELNQLGIPIIVGYRRCGHQNWLSLLPSTFVWNNIENLSARVSAMDNVIYHVHTSNNSVDLVPAVHDAIRDHENSSLVWDCHDWDHKTYNIVEADLANKIIIPNKSYKSFFPASLHGKIETIYSKVPKDWLQPLKAITSARKGICCVTEINNIPKPVWRDYRWIQNKLLEEYEEPLYIYPANNNKDFTADYKFLMQTLNFGNLF